MATAAILIDTAGPVVGVAAWDSRGESKVFVERIVAGADGWLTPALAAALGHLNGAEFRLGVVVGPGAFTGIRVGIAHALGLALARSISVVPVCALALRATLAPGQPAVLSMLDGKKSRVYVQQFDTTGLVPVGLDEPSDISPLAISKGAGPAVGEGAVVYALALAERGWKVVPDAGRSPVSLGYSLVMHGTPLDAAALRPVYLREPDAVPPPGVRSP